MIILGMIVTAIVGIGLMGFSTVANLTAWPAPLPWVIAIVGIVALVGGVGGVILSMIKGDFLG